MPAPFAINTNQNPVFLHCATPISDGLMCAADKAALNALIGGGVLTIPVYDNFTRPAPTIGAVIINSSDAALNTSWDGINWYDNGGNIT